MELNSKISKGLNKLGITKLTDIQNECLEPGIMGRNIIGCSGTGTGKTFAYLIPIISKNYEDLTGLFSVIIAPTKELCIQICSQINQLSNASGIPIRAAAVFGGVNKQRQLQTLKIKPNIIVGTCERVYELIKERKIPAHLVKTFVIDEADKLVNKDYIEQIVILRKCFMRDIQIMLFSASITQSTKKYAEMLTKEYVNIFTNEKLTIPTNIENIYFVVDRRDKIETVRKVIKALNTKHCIIFSNSKYDTEEITQKLKYHNYNAECIHSKCDKNDRRRIIDGFNNKKIDFLICSDIAARGLDFKNVHEVINIGLPEHTTDYLHRAGRSGRDGNKSVCASIITDNDLTMIKNIQKTFKVNMIRKGLYQGKIVRK